MAIIDKIKGFMLSPSKTFDEAKPDSLNDSFKYFASIVLFYAMLIAIVSVLFSTAVGSLLIMPFERHQAIASGGRAAFGGTMFISALVGEIVGIFIIGVIIHVGVYFVGGRNGLIQTIKVMMYGYTPFLILGWIPLVSGIALTWSFFIQIIGIRQLQELTTGKAILAVLLPFIIIFIIGISVILGWRLLRITTT